MVLTGWLVYPRACYGRGYGRGNVREYVGHWRHADRSWPGPINELKGHRMKEMPVLTDGNRIRGNRYVKHRRPLIEGRG